MVNVLRSFGGYSAGGPVTSWSPGLPGFPPSERFTAGLTAYPGSYPGTPTPDAALATAPQWQVDWSRDTALPGQLSLTRTTSATRYDSRLRRVSEASGGPRLDYDPATGSPLGLLLEEQRTNLILHSSDIKNNTLINTLDSAAGLTASTNTESDGLTVMYIYSAAGSFRMKGVHVGGTTITSGATYTFTLEVRKTNYDYLFLSIADSTGSGAGSRYISVVYQFSTNTFNQTAVGVGGGGVLSSWGSTLLANGNVRLTITGSLTTTGIHCMVGLAVAGTSNDFTTENNGYVEQTVTLTGGFEVGAYNLELGAFRTSYILTTTAAVTRNADILGTTDSALLSDAGWEVETGEVNITSGSTATLLGVNTITALGVDTSGAITTADGGTQTTANTGTWSGQNRAGLAWTP